MTARVSTSAGRFFCGLHNWDSGFGACVAAIGNFDGMHVGHERTLAEVCAQSEQSGLPSVAIVVEVAASENEEGLLLPPLMRFREKIGRLLEHVDQVLCLRLTRREATQPVTFLQQLIAKNPAIRCLVSGEQFHLGRAVVCDFQLLETLRHHNEFSVLRSPLVSFETQPVTASLIRQAVAENRFETARHMLGRPFSIQGRVVKGQQLGQQLGWPTANLESGWHQYPLSGVFAVQVHQADGSIARGVANIGSRPTVDDLLKPILEVHILDFNNCIYGQQLSVLPLYKIRDEKKFSSLEELKAAIAEDIRMAKAFFAGEKQAGQHG